MFRNFYVMAFRMNHGFLQTAYVSLRPTFVWGVASFPCGAPSTEHCYTATICVFCSLSWSPRARVQHSGCVTPGQPSCYLTGDNPCVITCNAEHVRRFTLTRDLLWAAAMQVILHRLERNGIQTGKLRRLELWAMGLKL